MKKLFTLILLAAAFKTQAQQVINIGNKLPDINIGPIINAPVKSFNISKAHDNRIYILNMWGTWCTPCIPEMDSLAKLQKANPNTIRVIAISDDSPERLQKYLAKKPSAIWLASDKEYFFYRAFGLSYVGQSAIINSKHEVVALVRTDSVNQRMINDALKGRKIKSSAGTKEQAASTGKDLFGVDSTMAESYTVRGYMKGQESMGQHFIMAPYFGRRINYINACITTFYKDAYNIISSNQVEYENISEKEACNFDDKNSLYCVDLLVKPEQKDSIDLILQKRLQATLPIKARMTEKVIPVYVLKLNPAAKLKLPLSANTRSSINFGGRGFDGTGVTLTEFADAYLSNEFELPVVDETGLTKRYDIKTTVDIRTKENITKSITDLGLIFEKAERKMKMLVLYK